MSLPIYQHPSLTVLVDDSPNFLQSLTFQLDPTLPRKRFTCPKRALAWLREQRWSTLPPAPLLCDNVDAYPRLTQQHAVGMNLEHICRVCEQPERFMSPSVLVVDYSMPGMNGIEFCAALQGTPYKIILLTGTADDRVAIAAFNSGLIHRYIQKSDDNALERLSIEIAALQRSYFKSQSDALLGMLPLDDFSFVSDPAIERLFREITLRYKTVEHYLYTEPPGMLLYDKNGLSRLLVIATERTMNAHYEVAIDNGAPPSLLTALQERRVIPYFGSGDGMYSPAIGGAWYKFTRSAQIYWGLEKYYWAIFDEVSETVSSATPSFVNFMNRHLND
jgi:CheY-like chemotaxis protein